MEADSVICAEVLEDDEGDQGEQGQVLVTVVVEVHQERTAGGVQAIDARFVCSFADTPVGLAKIEQIGQAFRLANVDVFGAISIHVPDGEAVMEAMLQHRVASDPVIGTEAKLLLVGG